MERSRKLLLTNWTQANDALNQYFEGNKSKLAEHAKMSRTTVTDFFKSQPLREATFRKICLALRLNWQEVSSVQSPAPQREDKIDPLAHIREHCRQKILNQHSRMRLLSGEEIGVDQLYVDVWLLNRSPCTYQVSQDKLLRTFDLRNDRLGLGDRIQRNDGFKVADANPKLLILGKPGAGKTTFLKHLAVDWSKGQFQPDLIAVFIEFRRIQDGEWKLLDAICQELELKDPKQTEALLQQGKLLILMDGLDEVPTNALRRSVQKQLRQIAEEYASNRWILTCRTQIIKSIPDGFTSVEVADFRSEQVEQFVQNWFQASGQSQAEAAQQWEKFNHVIGRNPALKELTVTPVLLSLMCLVLHDEGEIPSQMADLYKRGIRLLLEKWNEAKEIEGREIGTETYRQLSVQHKEALLIEIAARKFENPENFVLFQQDEIAAQIAEFLHLANRQEGVAVLEAIEAQHGLLIERSDELWSFSHLTFQEYFTVQWLTQLPPKQLAEKIANPRWQWVVEQLVKYQHPADRLLRLIKQAIDRFCVEQSKRAEQSKINQVTTEGGQKAVSLQSRYKLAAVRAFYFELAIDHALDLDHTLALAGDLDSNLARDLTVARVSDFGIINSPARDFAIDLDFARALACARDLARDFAIDLDFARDHIHKVAQALTRINRSDPALKSELEKLYQKLPKFNDNVDAAILWWRTNGDQWITQLRQVMIKHQNIGHDWQLTESQRQQLQRYYDANRFLVKLMQIEGAVSQEARAEIEDSLLLPWEELQRRYPETYGNA